MKLLVTGAWKSTEEQLKFLALSHEIIFMQNESDDLPCDYLNVEGVICNGLFLYHPIEKFKSLKYIQLTSAGFDRVPMDYVVKQGIKIHNARGVYSVPMAEFVISGVLQLYKQSRFFYDNQKKCIWEKHRGLRELFNKTICIVGCGSVGRECAKRFKAFGCKVIGVDLYQVIDENFENVYSFSDIEKCLSVADVVVLTVPLTKDTQSLMNKTRFKAMQDGAILVNVSRGAVVNENDLIEALESKLAGAVIDVFETEPLHTNSPLWNNEKVIITPHNSFVGENNINRLRKVIFNNLEMKNQ